MEQADPAMETDVSVSENEEQPEEEEEEEPKEEEEEEEEEETDDSMVMTPPVAQDPRNETAAAGNGTNPVEDASSDEPVWDRVDVDTFAQTMEDNPNAFLLDVRTEPEWNDLGYIGGAVLIPHVEEEGRVNELPEDKTELILLYCGSGKRSQVAAETLLGLGFTNLQELEPGIKGWIAQGKPVEQV